MKSINRLTTTVLTAFVLFCSRPVPAAAQQPIPIEHQYLHLLRWQIHLDKVAAEHEKQGKDGAWLRNALQKQLHFTDQQFAPVRESAQRLASSLNAIDAKAKSTMTGYRAQSTNGRLSAEQRAALRAQIRPIQAERENALAAEIATLNANLGPDGTARLRRFIDKQFSKAPQGAKP